MNFLTFDQKNKISIIISTSYSLPRHNIFKAILDDSFNAIKNNFIIGGDYYAKHQSWGCRANSLGEIILYNLPNERNINTLTLPGPTYWLTSPNKNPNILDIFAAKISNNLHSSTNNILNLK